TEKRTPAMFVYDRVPNFAPRCMCPRSNPRGRFAVGGIGCPARRIGAHNLSFHFADDAFCFVVTTMNHQPAWTLRNPAAKENHDQTQRRTDSKRQPPSKPDWNPTRIEQHKRGGCAQC